MERLRCSAGHGAVYLINSDSPTLPVGYLVAAATTLAAPGDRIVLGPSTDGGYYLIGTRRPHPALFEDIAWSTDQVRSNSNTTGDALLESSSCTCVQVLSCEKLPQEESVNDETCSGNQRKE